MQRTLIIALCILFRLALSLPNYANPGGAGDWTQYDGCKAAVKHIYFDDSNIH